MFGGRERHSGTMFCQGLPTVPVPSSSVSAMTAATYLRGRLLVFLAALRHDLAPTYLQKFPDASFFGATR